MTHHTLVTKGHLDLLGRPVKIKIQIFSALNVVPGPLDSRLVQHLFYVTKIRMASLDELDGPSPIKELLDTVALVIIPKKEAAKVKVKPRPRPRPKPKGKKPSKGGLAREDPPSRKTEADKKNKSDSDGKKMENWKKGALAVGIAAALVGAIAASVAPNLIKCDNATMTVTDIYPTGLTSNTADSSSLTSTFQSVFAGKPTTVDVKYTINNDYKINEGKDKVDFSGTGTILDAAGSLIIEKVVDSNTIRVSCDLTDCSNVFSNKGTGEPRCSFEDAVNTELYEATKGVFDIATDGLSSFFSGLMPMIGPVLIGILGFIALIVGLPLLFSLFGKGGSSSNKGSPNN